MRFLLDTNVLSEPARPDPEEKVVRWMAERSPLDLAISVLTLGEIETGIARLPAGARRTSLEEWVSTDLPGRFKDRVLPVNEEVAKAWGRLTAEGRRAGRPLPVIDGLLVATASANDLTFVTRNASDCAGRGIPVLDPWR